MRQQHRRSELWSYSSDEQSSHEENDELWSAFEGDEEFDCPYELLTLEEALRQLDEGKKERLASGDHTSLASRCQSKKVRCGTTNEAAELSTVFNVSSGDAIVQRLWVEYDVEINVQMNRIAWLERGLIESAVVRLIHEATAADFELMSAEGGSTLSSERSSFKLEVQMDHPLRTAEAWKIESGNCPIQDVECVFKPMEELADFKLRCVKENNRNWLYVQKAEADRPSHGIQTFVVEDEPQWGPRHSAQVVRTAYQCGQDDNADIELTGASCTRLRRKKLDLFSVAHDCLVGASERTVCA